MILTEGHLDSYVAKTAHGLLRYSKRYNVKGVLDSHFSGQTTDQVVPDCRSIPVYGTLDDALGSAGQVDHLILGVATVGGYVPGNFREIIKEAMGRGIGIISGLHTYLGDDPELSGLARDHGVRLYDIRRSPPLEDLHYFANRKKNMCALTVPFQGTDSSIGKRTALIAVYECMVDMGMKVEWVATGQTGLLQGAAHGLPLDSIKGDYMVGELEYQIWRTWEESEPDVILVEGQGSITHPAYVCGSRAVLSASQPDGVVMIHAPGRIYRHYREDEIRWPMSDIETEMAATKFYTRAPVLALGINPEGIPAQERKAVMDGLEKKHGLPCCNALEDPGRIASAIGSMLKK